MSKIKIICDKCHNSNVGVEEINKPEPEEVLMSNLQEHYKSVEVTHDVYIFKHYRAVCFSCGHQVEFQV